MSNGNGAKKPPAIVVLTQEYGVAGVHMHTENCTWQNAVNMLINALVRGRRAENEEKKKVVVEAAPGDKVKLGIF